MSHLLRRKPSAPLAISIAALMSGTAIAASNLVRGDSLIKKHSLSGNRLRNHTLTGNQINLAKLGTVPRAARRERSRFPSEPRRRPLWNRPGFVRLQRAGTGRE